eukprot:6175946-Pleurochrysis_carterae.AAC.1
MLVRLHERLFGVVAGARTLPRTRGRTHAYTHARVYARTYRPVVSSAVVNQSTFEAGEIGA